VRAPFNAPFNVLIYTKYKPLKNEIRNLYGVDEVQFHELVIGARGEWFSQNTKCLTSVVTMLTT
jgi:hypothetical protein